MVELPTGTVTFLFTDLVRADLRDGLAPAFRCRNGPYTARR
jgi:hypothetical protein